ncbi:6-bladed beta-propeller [Carboxylicivirga marina]|uniref:6-bladed beta-propeller n=1 Tax=Carboxylicivirga marina TaxID=2800988 RepID=A0ABS1HE35_9BACT|nr:6-bladed beta-propeller [Carboxylicivirga marina]MBK3515883.1 hypothetical protein [Carboxylicivirga marina]
MLNKNEIAKEESFLVFPLPPDTARIQFLNKITSEEDLKPVKQSFFYKYITGEEVEIKELRNPYGITVKKNYVYITDIALKSLVVMNLSSGRFEYFKPQGEASLNLPINCEVDHRGHIFIVDNGTGEVKIFDSEKKYIGRIKNDDLKPFDICTTEDNLFITNLEKHTIDVYENSYPFNKLYSFPDVEEGDDSYLYQPKSISVLDDKIYVSDWGDFKTKVYSVEGKYIRSVGKQGLNFGSFARPKGIGVDYEGNIFAVDAAFQNVQLFNEEGQLLMFFGGGGYQGPGYLYMPSGIYIDNTNNEYFEKFLAPGYKLLYLIFVTNQHGPDKVSVYARVEKI